jgi:hypothetical protein
VCFVDRRLFLGPMAPKLAVDLESAAPGAARVALELRGPIDGEGARTAAAREGRGRSAEAFTIVTMWGVGYRYEPVEQ